MAWAQNILDEVEVCKIMPVCPVKKIPFRNLDVLA